MTDFTLSQQLLREQLAALTQEEQQINADLNNHVNSLLGKGKSNNGMMFDTPNISNELQKVENFDPVFESILENAKKMSTQVEECRNLSDRLSSIVLKLDNKQMRVQKALACTEDILNLKECKYKIIAAIEENNLAAAVSFIRQVHDIDQSAAKTSEDYEVITQKEKEVKELVRAEFQKAITESSTAQVMQLCPLLQTLGLETEARDNFLTFMEQKVFIGVSADAYAIEGTSDPTTAYAQALSGVFNSTYLILQQYLPMVIQGLENSLGDVHFIRKLHKKCEQEAGLILKRYMKFRGIRDILNSLKTSNAQPQGATNLNQADLHSIMDELALLIQYCCKYSKYIKHVCQGAESKVRSSSMSDGETIARSRSTDHQANNNNNVVVFVGQLDFDKMIEELVNKYYMEGEQYLLRSGVKNTLPKLIEEGSKLDECFFVLQKCGLRSLATNNIQAACAILNFISDIISNDLLNQANEMMYSSLSKVTQILQDHIQAYKKQMQNADGDHVDQFKGSSLYGLSGAMSLASTLAGGVSTQPATGSTITNDIVFHESGGFSILGKGADGDSWGTNTLLEAFNITELCARYSDRLSTDLYTTSLNIFAIDEDTIGKDKSRASTTSGGFGGGKSHGHGGGKHGSGGGSNSLHHVASDGDRLKMCKDNLDICKAAFNNALRQGIEKMVNSCQAIVKDVISFILSRNGIYGGLRFEDNDSLFDKQPILVLLPKILTVPFDTIVLLLTSGLSERNKDFLVGLLADSCSEKVEAFLNQNNFSLAGALKMEEIVRALSSLFTKHASSPVRGKFSRLREIMLVLTAENIEYARSENFTNLTANEVEAFFGLRIRS